jgi:hypothetical protein
MTGPGRTGPDEDDRLLDELGDAIRSAQAVPEPFRAAARAAYAWRTVDAELAELIEDSTAPLAGARAGAPGPRTIRFRTGELVIEVELTADALQGQLVPAGPGRIELESAGGGSRDGEVDTVGWFLFAPPPVTTFRLRVRPASGPAVVTAWTAPGVSAG